MIPAETCGNSSYPGKKGDINLSEICYNYVLSSLKMEEQTILFFEKQTVTNEMHYIVF